MYVGGYQIALVFIRIQWIYGIYTPSEIIKCIIFYYFKFIYIQYNTI